jgi:beta-1,2-mannobiose phosphorylase / 1,2-beta-oligomannan phosphorylase
LTDDALVLIDDSNRGSEKQVIALWSAETHGGRRYKVIHELDRATVLSGVPVDGMHWADRSRGTPLSKDPSVVHFGGRYLMYVSVPPKRGDNRWGQAVAASDDLSTWNTIGEIEPHGEAEANGLCAGGAIVLGDRLHLFYQTYARGPDDAICHATSTDGVTFERSPDNPIIRPTGDWTCGRAIDAEAHVIGDELFCYWATRDPELKVQMLGVHSATLASDFSAKYWRQRCTESILKPELPWEKNCIEAPTICRRGDTYVMFYAGGYNNEPQQIGVAFSKDGLSWERMSDQPFLANGKPGEWNSSESGHPSIFIDPLEGATWLFYQGNNDHGKSWYISRRRIDWDGHVPRLA